MNSDLIKQAIEVIASGDESQALDVLKQWIASAAGCDADTPDPDDEAASAADDEAGDADGSEGDGAEGVPAPPKTKKAKAEAPKVEANGLTAMQNRLCREKGIAPETFLAMKRALNPSIKHLQAAVVQGGGEPMAMHGAFAGGGGSDGGGYTMRGGFKPTR